MWRKLTWFQGAGTLYTITSQLVKGGDIGKTLDMKVELQSHRFPRKIVRVGRLQSSLLRIWTKDSRRCRSQIPTNSKHSLREQQVHSPDGKRSLWPYPGSIVAILSSLNNVLYSGNPDDIPLTDIEAAAGGYFPQSPAIPSKVTISKTGGPPWQFWDIIVTSADLPYDTDIPDDGADIPEDPNEAFRANAMKITRINSVNQVILFSFVLPGV